MTSTGLTAQQISIIWQNIVLQCLAIAPSGPTDASAYSQVRIDWPTPGQPAWAITQDVAFIQAVEVPDDYNTAHEVQPIVEFGQTFPENTIYTRVWQIDLIFYGPNSFDHSRQVKDCIFQDFVRDILEASNLYPETVVGTSRRTPELFQNQWWERNGFSIRMNEQITDSLTKQAIQSVEFTVEDAGGIVTEEDVAIPTFIDAETPQGVIDGVNATFTLANDPNPPESLVLFLNGVFQHEGERMDYLLAGQTIVLSSPVPVPSIMLAYYRI